MKKPIQSVGPGLVFVHNGEAYLKTTEVSGAHSSTAANISTGQLICFDPNVVVELTEFEYSYYA